MEQDHEDTALLLTGKGGKHYIYQAYINFQININHKYDNRFHTWQVVV